MSASKATVVVAGMGDLGGRVLNALARSGSIDRLIACGRDEARTRGHAAQAGLVAELCGGPPEIKAETVDLRDAERLAATLERVAPDVIVAAAAEHTWWRGARAALPYACWLPLQVPLVEALMRAQRAAAPAAHVVCLPFPDAIGPILAGRDLAPAVGAGNVAEVAAKLARLTGAPRAETDVRLVMHHAGERAALSAFSTLGTGAGEPGEAPWRAEVHVRGEALSDDGVAELFAAPHPLREGRDTHELTAASTAAIVRGLLADDAVAAHAPAPGGRPGGYPVLLSRGGPELHLPAGITEADARALNERAARWDGIAAIAGDGTVELTDWAADALSAVLGTRVAQLAPGDLDALADALRERAI